MADRELVRSKPSSKLLAQLIDLPSLPTLVPQLKTPTLTRIIDSVGIEDAGPIVALTTTHQLRRVFDETLWKRLAPGVHERLSPEEFVRWLDVLNEQGQAFAAERLEALGIQFLASQFALVIEVQAKETVFGNDDVVLDEAEDFGNHKVVAKVPEDWETLRASLAALHTDFPHFLEKVLDQCTATWATFGPERAYVTALEDESADRDARREAEGYVTPDTASAFLAEARVTSIEDLVDDDEYDIVTRRFFAANANPVVDPEAQDLPAVDAADFDQLDFLLKEAEVVDPRFQLAGPSNAPQSLVRDALNRLETGKPEIFGDRLRELVYIGNVLVVGAQDPSTRLTEVEAAHAALDICNIGAGYWDRAGLPVDELVSEAPGLIRAFRIGWHIIQRIPARAARRLVEILRDPEIRQRLELKAWILTEVDTAIADLVNRVDLARYSDVDDTLSFVSLVVEAETVAKLKVVIHPFPRIPLDVEHVVEEQPGKPKRERVTVRTRGIARIEDLQLVDEFLATLPAEVKL